MRVMKKRNISLSKENIELKCGVKYIVMDALYINDIREVLSNLDTTKIFDEISNKVFPYTANPFAVYIPVESSFSVYQIEKVDDDQIIDGDTSSLDTDCAVLIFINEKIFLDFVPRFDYDELVDSDHELLNMPYWDNIADNYDENDLAIIVSPGIGSGADFDGSGSYRIKDTGTVTGEDLAG